MNAVDRMPLHNLCKIRSQWYWFLARCYTQRPEAAFLREIQASLEPEAGNEPVSVPDNLTHEQNLLHYLAQMLSAPDNGKDFLTQVGKEYTRLFRGLEKGYGPPPPYASVYLESRLMGESTIAIKRYYHQAGFEVIDPELGPQDHLGALLRFMAMLAFQQYEALEHKDNTRAEQLANWQEDFFTNYIVSWVPDYCQKLINYCDLPFYRYIAQMTAQFMQQEKEDFAFAAQEAAYA